MDSVVFDRLTIPALLAEASARGDQPALGVIQGGQLSWRTWTQLATDAADWAETLASLGVAAADRVAQVSPNSEGWILTDLAIQLAGGVHVPMHATLSPPQIAEQVADCEARLVVASEEEQADRIRDLLPSNVALVVHCQLRRLAADSTATMPPTMPNPDDLATILYTSGTTGAPLGVMLSHRNIVANAVAATDMFATRDDDVRLGVLPLSHIYARTCDLYSWLYRGGRLVLAESRETILRDCQLARPTAMNAVPYFYQKVADDLRAETCAVDGDALRARLGGAIDRCYCGGAALAPEVDRYFADRGLPILCGYGLTEASPVISCTGPETYESGTVGRPLPNLEVRVADDGEVLVRGPSVMLGYWRNDAATRRALVDGWLCTGDLGQLTPAGNLRIVGRKKELLVLATGKKASPTRIEQLLAGSPWIEQVCVLGDGRKFLTALIVPHRETLVREIGRRRILVGSPKEALNHPEVLAIYRQEIDRCLADSAECEQLGAFTLLPRAFSIDEGELTPKFSLRRSVIAQTFAGEINSMYERPKCPGDA